MANASRLAELPPVTLGPVEIRPGTREVIGPAGETVVEPRVMEVLLMLVRAEGGIVTRDALIETCWDGRAVSEDALNRVIARLRRVAMEVGGGLSIKTVHKVGYRLLVAPTEVGPPHALEPTPRSETPEPTAAPAPKLPVRTLIAGAVAAMIVLLALFWVRSQPPADPPTVAVLPFRSIGPAEPAFAEGVSEEIANELVRLGGLRVVGRHGGRDPGAGAAHLLEGSVRAAGGRVRISVALTRARDGVRLWGESYDGAAGDVLQVQQRIGRAVGEALAARLLAGRASAPSGDPEAVRLYLTARGLLRARDPVRTESAVALLRQAVARDPGFAPAWAALGKAYALGAGAHGEKPREREALALLQRALRLSPDLAEAHAAVALVRGFRGAEAERHIARAVRLSPEDAEIAFWAGHVHGSAGRFEAQLRAYARAAELDPLWERGAWHAARSALELGRPAEAAAIEARVRATGETRPALILAFHSSVARGDLSQALRIYARLDADAPVRGGALRYEMAVVRRTLGLLERTRHAGFAFAGGSRWWLGEVPSVPELLAQARTAGRTGDIDIDAATKNLLDAGGAAPLAALYDEESGLLGWSRLRRGRVDMGQMEMAPTAALVLRAAGREVDARAVLAAATPVADATCGRGPVPPRILFACARLWAVAGQGDRALAGVQRAVARGWLPLLENDRRDLASEPAFRGLAGSPLLRKAAASVAATLSRERAEAVSAMPPLASRGPRLALEKRKASAIDRPVRDESRHCAPRAAPCAQAEPVEARACSDPITRAAPHPTLARRQLQGRQSEKTSPRRVPPSSPAPRPTRSG